MFLVSDIQCRYTRQSWLEKSLRKACVDKMEEIWKINTLHSNERKNEKQDGKKNRGIW